jgi:hypothetical protein
VNFLIREVLMLNNRQKKELLKNWEVAESGFPYAEVRLYAPKSSWECYLIALNPRCEDEVICLLHAEDVEITNWTLTEIKMCFDSDGNSPYVDLEFRRRKVSEIIKDIRELE